MKQSKAAVPAPLSEPPQPVQAPPPPQPVANAPVLARVWREGRPGSFPEDALPEFACRPLTGVAFSGGGSRGFVASLSQLHALHSLALTPHIRTLSAVSGGGWAASAFCFYQPGGEGEGGEGGAAPAPPPAARAPATDAEFFDAPWPPLPPERLSASTLSELSHTAARGAVCRRSLVDATLRGVQAGRAPSSAWTSALSTVIFEPLGVGPSSRWAASAASDADARARNPSLPPPLLPRPGRPFLVLAVSLLGPVALVPHRPLRLRQYTLLEATPLYAGVPHPVHARFARRLPGYGFATTPRLVGGLIESFAFGGPPPVAAGRPVPRAATSGLASLPPGAPGLSLTSAAAASSFAPGGLLATQLPSRRVARLLGWPVPYWAPASGSESRPPKSTDMLIADGGCVANPAVQSLLQRGAERVVLFLNYQTPLAPRSVWDPHARPPTAADVSEELPALFGFDHTCEEDAWLTKLVHTAAWSFHHNAVFEPSGLPRVASALQDAAAAGAGAVVTMEHVTVANQWYGLPAGRVVTVTWVYLSAAPAWVDRLPEALQSRLRDPKDAELGPSFPHLGTLDLALSPTQVNLLTHLVSWVMHAHAHHFVAALSPDGAAASAARRAAVAEGAAAAARARHAAPRAPPPPPSREARREEQIGELARVAAEMGVGLEKGEPPHDEPPSPGRLSRAVGRFGSAVFDLQRSSSSAARHALSAAYTAIRGVLPSH